LSEYRAAPRATTTPFAVVPVALAAATIKTVLQVNIPSAQDIRVIGWGVSFDGASGTAIPVICQLIEGDVAASTGTSFTPDAWGNAIAPASVCIGGAALTGYNFGTEGTMTAVRELDSGHTHPQSGYGLFWPGVEYQPKCGAPAAARFLRVRCTAPAIVNVIPWVIWAEPAL
jgi:hypothetical protein